MHSTLIIAEAGVNHNGDLNLAKSLIDAARSAGADAVKFQTFSAKNLVTPETRKAEYQARTTGNGESQHEMIRRLELTPEMHEELIKHCKAREIEFLSTAFDIYSLNYLRELGLKKFKVSSGEITNLPYLRHLGTFRQPVILSTGMATIGEIESAVTILQDAGTPRAKITALHCTTEYPAQITDVNLRAMNSIQDALGIAVGYSDHTVGIEVAIAAVARGASIIEKHLTLDRNLPGPDHAASLEKSEFAAMVASIRKIDQALGDGVKRPTQGEQKNMGVIRKSLVASKFIRAGETFTVDNVTVKRPGTGISPMRWDEIIGRRASRDFAADELISI
jgi:N,N'-diacetyllegionaminate synthase